MDHKKLEFQVARDIETLRQVIELGKCAIWSDDKLPLNEAIEKATDEMNANAKIRVRACKNLKFSRPVEYKEGGKKITAFTELGAFLTEYGKRLNNEDVFIVTSNNYVELFELMQQFIYIGLHPKVYTFEDYVKKETSDEFFKLTEKIRENCNILRDFLVSQTDGTVKEIKDDLLNKINRTEQLVNESKKNLITLAVFATKKTGKSMVVNCLVKDEFAPTSQELPTPNNIIYKPLTSQSTNREIILHYNEGKYRFKNSKEVRKFIRDEFKKVEKSGKRLTDMIIEYPTKDPLNFEIIDTPGPDLAGSEHALEIDRTISSTDIAIFIIDYSKYAQNSEIDLFRKVRNYFDKIGKQHSFICLVNKYDMIYQDTDTEKIIVRVSDFIREKLKYLGFDRFVVIPVSALTWFYLYKIHEKFPDVKQQEDIRMYLEYEVEDKIEEDDDEFRTIIAFIQNLANYIRSTYQIKKPNYYDLIESSNFEIFLNYLIDITNDKAKVEKIFSYISQIDSLIVEITNLIEGTKKLKKAHKEKIIDELSKFQKELEESIKNYIENEAQKKIYEITQIYLEFTSSTIAEVLKRTKENFREIVDIEFLELSERISDDVDYLKKKQISRDDFVNKYKNIKISIRPNLDASSILNNSQLIQKSLHDKIQEANQSLQEFLKIMREKIDTLSSTLNKKFNIEFNIQVPNINLYFDFEFIKKQLSRYSERVLSNSITLDSSFFDKIIEGGFWRWFGSIFGGDRYKVDEGALNNKINQLKERIKEQANSILRSLEYDLNDTTKKNEQELMKHIEHQTEKISDYVNSVRRPTERISEILNKDIEVIESIILLFDKFSEKIAPLRSLWKELMDRYNARKAPQ